MPDEFLKIPTDEQLRTINALSARQGKPATILEKDIWVCWTLKTLFEMPNKKNMAFKGGTSLSKAYNIIKRFSEDVDVTIDYRDFVTEVSPSESRTSIDKKSEKLKEFLRSYSNELVKPYFENAVKTEFERNDVSINLSASGAELKIFYPSVLEEPDTYVEPAVLVEFGARNFTEPNEKHTIKTFASEENLPGLSFPEAEVTVLSLNRTFWEKVTLIHVACNRGISHPKTERLSRHWYDLALLYLNNQGKSAIKDVGMRNSVINHKKAFFHHSKANYDDCLNEKFNLVPEGDFQRKLQADFEMMIRSGMFFEEPNFGETLQLIKNLQIELNGK